MLSYQHGYHAGNFADVIKHLTLSRILHYLIQKDKPLFYLDTHSGRGIYDLQDKQALKTEEYLQGIHLLWSKRNELPAIFSPYMSTIEKLNDNQLRFYPGSPALAIHLLRPEDRLFCSELHPLEFEYLKKLPKHHKRVFFNHQDGINDLKATLPPIEHRGLVFMDPAYEVKSEYKQLPKAIKSAYRSFSNGTFCLWYPFVNAYNHEQLLGGLMRIEATQWLHVEFHLTKLKQIGMTGCGLFLINPPHVLAEEMKTILTTLCKLFNPGSSFFTIESS